MGLCDIPLHATVDRRRYVDVQRIVRRPVNIPSLSMVRTSHEKVPARLGEGSAGIVPPALNAMPRALAALMRQEMRGHPTSKFPPAAAEKCGAIPLQASRTGIRERARSPPKESTAPACTAASQPARTYSQCRPRCATPVECCAQPPPRVPDRRPICIIVH